MKPRSMNIRIEKETSRQQKAKFGEEHCDAGISRREWEYAATLQKALEARDHEQMNDQGGVCGRAVLGAGIKGSRHLNS